MAGDKVYDRAYIESLVDASTPEAQGLEYKQEPPQKKDPEDREEFLKDVAGMANASGGVILYGMTNRATLKPLQNEPPENFDQLERRLRSWVASGIEPTLHGLHFSKVDVDGGYVLALTVPNTMAGPFWGKAPAKEGQADAGRRIFKIRRGTAVIDMSYHEVREAFDRNSNALIQARDWSQGRLKSQREMAQTGQVLGLIHIIPLGSYQQPTDPLDSETMRRNQLSLLPFIGQPMGGIPNFDGYRFHGESQWYPPYAQVFRNGAIEMAQIVSLQRPMGEQYAAWPLNYIRDTVLLDFVRFALHSGLTYRQQLGASSSTMICVSLVQANQAMFGNTSWWRTTDRDTLAVPPFILESITLDEIKRVAKEALDMLFQAYGFAECRLEVTGMP